MTSAGAILLGCCACLAARAADPMVRARVPDDGRMTMTDYGCRDWGPELVHADRDPALAGWLRFMNRLGRAPSCLRGGTPR